MDGGNVIFKFTGDDKQLQSVMKSLGSIGKTALTGMVAGTTAVVAGFTAVVKKSVEARGEMEQLMGGVETIFKGGADKIVENANRAYKESGISASKYMEQATSFGASLRRSLGDNDAEIAKYVDMAIKDMADNSAKMGTSIEQIQNAYAGLAKGNATMLDNLKVGYGGTQKEMLQLAKDMGVVNKNMKSFNDMSFDQAILAIHKVQEQLELTGTASKEATETMTGSIAMLKASWENFLSGNGDLGQVVESAGIAFDNVMRIVNEAMPQITEQIVKYMPQLVETGIKLIGAIGEGIIKNLPALLETAGTIIESVGKALGDNLDIILDKGMDILLKIIEGIANKLPDLIPKSIEILTKIATTIINHLPQIIEVGVKILVKLIEGIIKSIPTLIRSMGQVTNSIANILKGLYSQAISWGADMIRGFGEGVMNALSGLKQRVESVANSIRSRLHFSRPDEGPLRDYETWMPDMLKGMANSLDKATPSFIRKIDGLSSQMAMGLSPSLSGTYSYSPSMSVINNVHVESDPLGQMVSKIKTFSNGAKNDYNYGYGG